MEWCLLWYTCTTVHIYFPYYICICFFILLNNLIYILFIPFLLVLLVTLLYPYLNTCDWCVAAIYYIHVNIILYTSLLATFDNLYYLLKIYVQRYTLATGTTCWIMRADDKWMKSRLSIILIQKHIKHIQMRY